MKHQSLVLSSLAFISLSGCGPSVETQKLQQENNSLKQQIESLTNERNALATQVKELSITPSILLNEVTTLVKNKKIVEAEKPLNTLKQKHPAAAETQKAQELINNLRMQLAQQEKEARELEALGFKAIKPSAANTKEVKISISSPSFTNRFVHNSYDDRYHYHDADRDHKYLTYNLEITAAKGVTDPKIPGFALYKADGKVLRKISDFELKFKRWEDFGTFLGNYHDSSNDFAKTASIPFTIGAHTSNENLENRPLYIIATKFGCLNRNYERFKNPPVYYTNTCTELKNLLTINELTKDESKVILVKRID